ncbi:MAG: cupin domain-containing protein [Microbacterium sp.]|uniref:cupin domain-containing protein n=1 Tax=Microbacterium sp. TaxID=51671 RepID=UPI0026301B95|nr:cupin domain-containing protein [Microbacterium sp.]MCX6502824.1 cupin domain-containing protein [Microbacterium sp.]
MTVRPIWRAAVVLAAALALSACTGTPGSAPTASPTGSPTTPSPVSAVDHAAGEIDGPVAVAVDAGTDGVGVTFREITIEPGAGTGKHCHDGQLIAVVKEGTLTHYAPNHPGGVAIYAAGDAIIEGPGYVHEGRNEGDVPVVLWVTYLIPEGDPLAETDLSHCDA